MTKLVALGTADAKQWACKTDTTKPSSNVSSGMAVAPGDCKAGVSSSKKRAPQKI